MRGDIPKEGDIQVTNVDVPVRMPDGTVCGKARVVEGDSDEVSILVEIESNHPLIASLFKSQMCAISLFDEDVLMPGDDIREVEL
jgi:hypothetical protein